MIARPYRTIIAPYASFDPSKPEVLEWVASLKPEAELVVRMAMRQAFPRCRGDHAWSARIDALMAELEPDEDMLAHVLREARKTAKMIRETV
jgi:hypothetical protein